MAEDSLIPPVKRSYPTLPARSGLAVWADILWGLRFHSNVLCLKVKPVKDGLTTLFSQEIYFFGQRRYTSSAEKIYFFGREDILLRQSKYYCLLKVLLTGNNFGKQDNKTGQEDARPLP